MRRSTESKELGALTILLRSVVLAVGTANLTARIYDLIVAAFPPWRNAGARLHPIIGRHAPPWRG